MSELFISVEDFLVRSPEILEFLEPLDPNIGAIAVQASFCPDNGRALMVAVFDRKRQPDFEGLAQTLGDLGLECFELAALPAADREHFQRVELPRYSVRVDSANTVATALRELARRASADALHPKVSDDEWPSGTPAEAKAPPQLRPKKSPTAELAEAIDADFPPIESDEPEADADHPGGYQIQRQSTAEDTGLETSRPRPVAVTSPRVESERVLRMRFLRGERWLPGRVRYISNREARIASAAPPRLHDTVVIGVSFEGDELFVTGTVVAVDSLDDGRHSPGFTITLGKLDPDKKAHLVALLTRARDAGVSLRPPPSRRAPRFPVSWPVIVNTNGRPVRATALDVSWSGLYLDVQAPAGSELLFALPLDVETGAIRGRARVVRMVDDFRAAEYQTAPGIGVAITHLGPGDDVRYRAFLERVKQRCRRRVLVGAAPIRAQGLSRALAAVGYAVTSSTDASALVELTGRESRPPDIAIIDESLGNATRPTLVSLFRSRNVPTLSTRGDQSDTARRVVDQMLAVKDTEEE